MIFDRTPKIIQRFEDYGYAKCDLRRHRNRKKFKNIQDGDVLKIVRFVHDEPNSWYMYFAGTRGRYSVYYFKPITKKEYEKRKLMEVLQ